MILLSDDHGAVRVLTMNRPEVRNALSTELFEALYAALGEADADDSVRAVVLTGTDPAFCAGVDLKQAQNLGMDAGVGGADSDRNTGPQPRQRNRDRQAVGNLMNLVMIE